MGNTIAKCADCKNCHGEWDNRVGLIDASDEYYGSADGSSGRPRLVKHMSALGDGPYQEITQDMDNDHLDWAQCGKQTMAADSPRQVPQQTDAERKHFSLDSCVGLMRDITRTTDPEEELSSGPGARPEFQFDLHGAAEKLKEAAQMGKPGAAGSQQRLPGLSLGSLGASSPAGTPRNQAGTPRNQLSARSSASASQLSAREASRSGGPIQFDDLHLDYMFFNPLVEPLRSQLLQKLGVHPNSEVQAIKGRSGSSNAGMWVLKDYNGSQDLMMKLVRVLPGWIGPSREPESEKFARLSRDHPEMATDICLSIPFKVFHCLGKGGSKSHDLIVMHFVPGVPFSEFIMQKLHGGHVEDLMRALHWFGSFLADFHERYHGLQHGDLTPANVFVDEKSNRFTMVDVADIAPRNPVIQSDVDRFVSGLDLLSNFHGENLMIQGSERFKAGYAARRSGQIA